MRSGKIYWFAYYGLASPSVRYRAKYPLELIGQDPGMRVRLVIPSYSFAGIVQFLFNYVLALFSGSGALIVIQRVSSDQLYGRALKLLVLLKKNTLYDIDDAEHLERPPKNILWFVEHCRTVAVGSHELLKSFGHLNSNIILNTSPVPPAYFTRKVKNAGLFTVGWIGDHSGDHRRSLNEQLFPALLELPFPVRLVLLGVRDEHTREEIQQLFCHHSHVSLQIPLDVDWNNERAIQERICTFDVGIATLMDNELHRSKSAFKLKQYMNNGVPVLSTKLPENAYFLDHGRNGFLCRDAREFKERLMEVEGMDAQRYALMCENARATTPRFDQIGYCRTLLSLLSTTPAAATLGWAPLLHHPVQSGDHRSDTHRIEDPLLRAAECEQ